MNFDLFKVQNVGDNIFLGCRLYCKSLLNVIYKAICTTVKPLILDECEFKQFGYMEGYMHRLWQGTKSTRIHKCHKGHA